MRILILGGTGLLGSYALSNAKERGHDVSILTRGKTASAPSLPQTIRRIVGDIELMGAAELTEAFAGQDAIVYALGLDDRRQYKKPAYAILHADHVDICLRVLRAARSAGARKFVVFGSYFSHFDRLYPELKLAESHPYVKTRCEQRDAVLGETTAGFDTFVLEIPYVLGALAGKVSPWSFMIGLLVTRGRFGFFFSKGGTAAVTASQVGRATIGAIEGGIGGRAYPLGGINLEWPDLARRIVGLLSIKKTILNLPPSLFALYGWLSSLPGMLRGQEHGLDIRLFAPFHYANAFIDPSLSMAALSYGHEDYDAALAETVREWIAERSRGKK